MTTKAEDRAFLMGRQYERERILEHFREEVAEGIEHGWILREFLKDEEPVK
jgi:hypothetical protein